MKLYTKIFVGLLTGGLCGLAVNFWASGNPYRPAVLMSGGLVEVGAGDPCPAH